MNEYVDVRGPWPMYVNGMIAVTLVGENRNISLHQARIAALEIGLKNSIPTQFYKD